MRSFALAATFCVILAIFRVAGSYFPNELMNFSPFIAMFFCGAALMRKEKWLLPVAAIAWLVTTPIANAIAGYPLWNLTTTIQVVLFGLIAWFGMQFRGTHSMLKLVGGSLAACVMFYLVTNMHSFISNPVYPKNWAGIQQAFWTGAPVYELPTWVFFRNSVCATVLFTVLFLAAAHLPFFQVFAKGRARFALASDPVRG